MPDPYQLMRADLEDLCREVELLGLEEAEAVRAVGEGLRELFVATNAGLVRWLEREEEFERATDRLIALLEQRYDCKGHAMAAAIRDLGIVPRRVRAGILIERFPHLPASLIEGPASDLLVAIRALLDEADDGCSPNSFPGIP